MKKLILYTDGGSRGNPGPAAIGVLILNEKREPIQEFKQCVGETTNNVAEYMALIKGLELCFEQRGAEIMVYTDSELMARQLMGYYKVRASHLKPLYDAVKKLEKKFSSVTVRHVLRTNQGIVKADSLVNAALDGS
jgi:ribonuclease HI